MSSCPLLPFHSKSLISTFRYKKYKKNNFTLHLLASLSLPFLQLLPLFPSPDVPSQVSHALDALLKPFSPPISFRVPLYTPWFNDADLPFSLLDRRFLPVCYLKPFNLRFFHTRTTYRIVQSALAILKTLSVLHRRRYMYQPSTAHSCANNRGHHIQIRIRVY